LSANSRYGLGGNSVNVKAYNIQYGGYDVSLAVTSDTCVPVTEVVTGTLDPVFAGDYTGKLDGFIT
jgi:hypothetical protein